MKPDSLRIQVKALRKTVPDTSEQLYKIERDIPLPNPFQFSYDASALGMKNESYESDTVGTEIRVSVRTDSGEVWPIFPFAMGADSLYDYEFGSTIKFGGPGSITRTIIEVIVTPKHPKIPGVVGTFQIDADLKEVVGSDVVFNEAAQFSRQDNEDNLNIPIDVSEDHRIKTRKVLYSSIYWFPETMEEEFFVQVWGIKVKIHRQVEFLTYSVNPEPPDTVVFADKIISYNRDPELEEELFKGLEDPHQLTKEEEQLIIGEIEKLAASIDLNSELFDLETVAQDAMKMRMGHKSARYFQIAQRMSDFALYNRVEGLRLNYELSFSNLLLDNTILAVKGGYGFKDRRWKGEAAGLYFLDKKKRLFIEGNIYNTIAFNENKKIISNGKNTFTSLMYKTDYRDYYYKKGGNIGLGYLMTDNLAIKLYGVNQVEENAGNHTRFSIFRYKRPFRFNPEIMEGNLRGLRALILYKTGSFNAEFLTEHTDKKRLHSDFDYSCFQGNMKYNYKINYTTSLFFSASAAVSRGKLPPQRWFDFGGKSLFNYNGNLRGVGYKAFTGDRLAFGTIELTRYWMHLFDFKREKRRFEALRRMLKFTFWTGFGWSELSEKNRIYAEGIRTPQNTTEGLYHEFGIGIGDRMNFARLDFIRNSISKNNIKVSINFFR